MATNIQDLAMAPVQVREAQGPRWPVVFAGGGLFVLGVALARRRAAPGG